MTKNNQKNQPATDNSNNERPFYEKPLEELTDEEWEQLCDGCGLCCLNKLEDEDTQKIVMTRVACNLLNLETCKCNNYPNRKMYVPDCIKLTKEMLPEIKWLPSTCAYMLRYHKKPLRAWHPLICKDSNRLHVLGISLQGEMIHEMDMGDQDITDFIV